jgi:inorganic pyrophosphatase
MLVVIETPKGSPNKLAFEPRYGTFVLKGVLPAGAVFPFDFGFVPSTRAEDGDPLDVLVLMDAPSIPGASFPRGSSGSSRLSKPKRERRSGTIDCSPLLPTRRHIARFIS